MIAFASLKWSNQDSYQTVWMSDGIGAPFTQDQIQLDSMNF